ncbi:MAG: bifunctional precorrin-2 dehydrogenase/sirohydrochlorin ferrochelatase [Desulfobulbaceae bacterium]|nr:MAG: bifunctional precorrin-2 dehydrogenase/sirohydrochlorin ferrochelatase [Desulfobulbaceae bacterium]
MAVYPVNIEMAGRRCLVVGGGKVAARKLVALLDAGAIVEVVSPRICSGMATVVESRGVTYHQRIYRPTDLTGHFMVFAATDNPDVQKQILQDAKRAGVLLNCADMPEDCDFQLPARLSHHDLLVTISTSGASPAFSTRVRDLIKEVIGPEYGAVVMLMKLLRKKIIDLQDSSEQNKSLFYQILDLNLESLIRSGQWQEIEEKLQTILPYNVDISELVNIVRSEYLLSTSNLHRR